MILVCIIVFACTVMLCHCLVQCTQRILIKLDQLTEQVDRAANNLTTVEDIVTGERV